MSALQLISEAIQSPEAASRDATLLAALLLDLFEKMTTSVPYSKGAWVSHVNGAFSLVQLRGRDQFKRPLGIQLLVRLCNNLLISCIVSHQPIPSEFVLLRAAVAESVDSNEPKWRLGGLMVRFVELRQATNSQIVSPRQVLSLAESLDNDFIALVNDMPPSWQYETIFVNASSARVCGKCYHIYGNVYVTQTWNVLRLARILIKEIVLDQHSYLSNSSTSSLVLGSVVEECDTAEESIKLLAADICASVPQYTGLDVEVLGKNRAAFGRQNRICCYTLLFPLFVAAQSKATPANVRQWIIAQLHHMSKELSARNAELIFNILKRGEWVEPWSVYAMLGGYAFMT